MMRSKFAIAVLALLAALTLIAAPVMAQQSPNLEWNRWDQDITVQSNSDQMQIVETQELRVINGPLHFGARDWAQPVSIQSVRINGQPMSQSSNNQAGTYTVSQNSGVTTVQYNLATPQNTGATLTVQINYQATTPTSGVVDWQIVPQNHPFTVQSSTATIHFANGQVPDPSLARIAQGNGSAQVSGNEIIIQSQSAIPPQQAFAIQVPYGASVGAAANNGNTNPNSGVSGNPATGTAPDNGTTFNIGSWILPILCIVGILLLFGGGNLLRSLIGGLFGGGFNPVGGGYGPIGGNRGGGIFGGGNQGGGIFGGGNQGSSERGFRPSSNQDREVPNVGNDKNSGGGARFGR